MSLENRIITSPGSAGGGRILAVLLLGLAGIPLVAWALGSVVVHVAPASFRCEAVIRQPLTGAVAPITSDRVIRSAVEELAKAGGPRGTGPMAMHALWSGLSAAPMTAPGFFKVAASGAEPDEARRTLMAVVRAYESHHAAANGARLLVYAGPPVCQRASVPTGVRMALGLAGTAWLGLALAIPLLRWLEGRAATELRAVARVRNAMARISAIARASAAAEAPHAAGFLPAARLAG